MKYECNNKLVLSTYLIHFWTLHFILHQFIYAYSMYAGLNGNHLGTTVVKSFNLSLRCHAGYLDTILLICNPNHIDY